MGPTKIALRWLKQLDELWLMEDFDIDQRSMGGSTDGTSFPHGQIWQKKRTRVMWKKHQGGHCFLARPHLQIPWESALDAYPEKSPRWSKMSKVFGSVGSKRSESLSIFGGIHREKRFEMAHDGSRPTTPVVSKESHPIPAARKSMVPGCNNPYPNLPSTLW